MRRGRGHQLQENSRRKSSGHGDITTGDRERNIVQVTFENKN